MKHTAKLTLLTASITAILSAPAMATSADDIGGINLKLDQTNQRIEGVNNNVNLGINTVSNHLKVTNAHVASNQHLLNSVENGVKSNTNNIYHLEQQIHANENAIYSQMDDNKAASNQLTMYGLQMSAQNRKDNADQQKTIDDNHARLSNQEMTINDQNGRIHTAEQDSQHALGAIATIDKSITAINDHTAKTEASIQAFAGRTTDSIKANNQIGLDAQVAAANAQSTASKNTTDIALANEHTAKAEASIKAFAGRTTNSIQANEKAITAANDHTAKAEASIKAFAGRATDSIKANTQIGLDAQVAAANAQSAASKNTTDIALANEHTAKAEASIQAFAGRATDSIKANNQIGLDAQVAAANAQSTASKNTSDIALANEHTAKAEASIQAFAGRATDSIKANNQIGLDAQVAAANAQSTASKNTSDIALANDHTAKAEASIQAFAGRTTDSIKANTQIGLDAQVAAANAQSAASKNTSDIALANEHTAKAEASIQAFAGRATDSIKANNQIGLDAQVAAANAQSTASKNTSDIALANEHTAKAEASIQAFAGRATDSINSNSTAIADNTQIGLDAQVAAANAQSSASKNSSDIAINAKDIKDKTQIGLDAQVAAANAQSSASKNSSDIAINAKSTAQNESKTKANAESNQLTRNEAAQVITANAHAIQSNYDDIYEVRGQARSNTTQIANNAQDIHQNRVDINKNTADIKDLRSDLEEQAKQTAGIGAMAMATSNLVMPYSVGKFSVTAGVGNYDSESAIAVGSGYRFDDHLTVRANAAYETGSENVGVGAGVGYEF